jgi:aspartate/methionine/tyrosine aminotransferase
MPVRVAAANKTQLQQWEREVDLEFQNYKRQALNLDLTRGKPSAEQLSLTDRLDGILAGNYACRDGTDARNYGGLLGIPEMRQLGAELLNVREQEVIAGGNSSLTFMHQCMVFAYLYGPRGKGTEWRRESHPKFLCPVPGYDRHFSICEDLGLAMINVDMTETGPDMDQVETLIKDDPGIKGMWCVPKYSNPTGIVYSDATVERIARLGQIAPPDFRVFWDNAYAVHDLTDDPPRLAAIMELCRKHGTEDLVYQFSSTSKISFAGGGISFLAASAANLAEFEKHLFVQTIGPDKVNQLRHARMFPNLASIRQHMRKHAAVLRPKFEAVLQHLAQHFTDTDLGDWSRPQGGYFISFNTRAGLAGEVIRLAAEAGVKLTPAGSAFPYKKDPANRNIRLAPSFPKLTELNQAMAVFVNCVKLASVRQRLAELA